MTDADDAEVFGQLMPEKRKPSDEAELNHLNEGDREIKRSPDLLNT